MDLWLHLGKFLVIGMGQERVSFKGSLNYRNEKNKKI